MRNFSISILALAAFLFLPVDSYAGNPSNAAGGGNVTGIVVCEVDDDTEVDEISIFIVSEGCSEELDSSALGDLNCTKGSTCMQCLGELKGAGMTITRANAYVEGDGDDAEELAYHLLEGNAGPFLDRLGSCPD